MGKESTVSNLARVAKIMLDHKQKIRDLKPSYYRTVQENAFAVAKIEFDAIVNKIRTDV